MDHSGDLGVAVLGDPVVAVAQRDHGAVGPHRGDRLLDHGLHDLLGVERGVDQAIHLVEDCGQARGLGLALVEPFILQCPLMQLITLGRQLLAGGLQVLGLELESRGELFDTRLLGELGLACGVGPNQRNRSRAAALRLLA